MCVLRTVQNLSCTPGRTINAPKVTFNENVANVMANQHEKLNVFGSITACVKIIAASSRKRYIRASLRFEVCALRQATGSKKVASL